MKIGIIGGGNMGCVLATRFSQSHDVVLYTNLVDKMHLYKKDMIVFCEDNNSSYRANIKCITSSLKELCEKSEFIFITFPSFLFEQLSKDILPYLTSAHHLIFVPGSGGAELFFKPALEKGVTISGLQRVHCVARIMEFGSLTKESGIKKELFLASIPSSINEKMCCVLEKLYCLPVRSLDSYLNITFINSNPILHTSRLYSLFKDYERVKEYNSIPLFYEEWDVESANLLIEMDNELFNIIDYLNNQGLSIHKIKPLLEYYESNNAFELSNKLRSIKAFKGLTTPVIIKDNKKYAPDFSSRYFTADFPFGLDILLSFSRFLDLKSQYLELVSNWYHSVTNSLIQFNLRDFGFNCLSDLISYYK